MSSSAASPCGSQDAALTEQPQGQANKDAEIRRLRKGPGPGESGRQECRNPAFAQLFQSQDTEETEIKHLQEQLHDQAAKTPRSGTCMSSSATTTRCHGGTCRDSSRARPNRLQRPSARRISFETEPTNSMPTLKLSDCRLSCKAGPTRTLRPGACKSIASQALARSTARPGQRGC